MRRVGRISLRGTLATDYLDLLQRQLKEPVLKAFLSDAVNDEANRKVFESGGAIIVGKKADEGKFPPDW